MTRARRRPRATSASTPPVTATAVPAPPVPAPAAPGDEAIPDAGRAADRRPRPVRTVPLLELRPGDRVRLPRRFAGGAPVDWSPPVTVTGVLLVDTEMVQVRWEPAEGEDPFAAHALLLGEAFRAGALPAGGPGG